MPAMEDGVGLDKGVPDDAMEDDITGGCVSSTGVRSFNRLSA